MQVINEMLLESSYLNIITNTATQTMAMTTIDDKEAASMSPFFW